MKGISTRNIVLNGLMIALVFLATYFTRFPGPVPPGYINLGDILIMTAALTLGKKTGLLAGSVGSAIADLVSPGGFIFAPVTFIVKGIEGYVTGAIADIPISRSHSGAIKAVAFVTGAFIMVAGYFLAEAYVLGFIDKNFGAAAAALELPFNLVQGGISVAGAYLLSVLLEKAGIQRHVSG